MAILIDRTDFQEAVVSKLFITKMEIQNPNDDSEKVGYIQAEVHDYDGDNNFITVNRTIDYTTTHAEYVNWGTDDNYIIGLLLSNNGLSILE